jgi:hypothetical protein
MKMRLLMAIALCAIAATAQEAGPSRTPLTNRDVETLADAGFSEEFIVEMIGSSRPEFDTTAGAMAELKKHGINENVIRAMVGSRSTSSAPKADFGGRTQPIRVFVQAGADPRRPEARSQTAEIVHSFAANCPSLVVTNRKDAAAFLIVLDRAAGKLFHPAFSKMVVFDRGGDTVYGSERALPKAVRGFCAVTETLAATNAEESLPGSRLAAR